MERLFGVEQLGAPAAQPAPAGASEQGSSAAGEPSPIARSSRRPPLAARMRPRELAELVGQQRLLAPGSALRRAIETGRAHSMILHGPPGSGKTTLARIVAMSAAAVFEQESAVAAGRTEVRAVIERARARRRANGAETIFFLDEIHRFNKAQQDALLPAVEEGLVTLIGATTENPYFEINSALLSRCQVYELSPLSAEEVRVLLARALERDECAAGKSVEEAALEFIAARCGGDARAALGALELACEAAGPNERVTLTHAEDALQRRALRYDRQADQHYDTISAWIKATRGSDPDASLYYLAVMLEGGEDPRFIARRMVILASEDVGNADPQALSLATAAAAAVDHVGLPEAQYALAQAAIYLSLAPKSDAAKRSIAAARAHIREHGAQPPPAHLRSANRADGLYDNPHSHAGHISTQQLVPHGVAGVRFYRPDDAEAALARRLEELRRARGGT